MSINIDCPITYQIFLIPVICSDGKHYEKAEIQKWLINNDTSPLTKEKISKNIYIDYNLKSYIETKISKNKDLQKDQYKYINYEYIDEDYIKYISIQELKININTIFSIKWYKNNCNSENIFNFLVSNKIFNEKNINIILNSIFEWMILFIEKNDIEFYDNDFIDDYIFTEKLNKIKLILKKYKKLKLNYKKIIKIQDKLIMKIFEYDKKILKYIKNRLYNILPKINNYNIFDSILDKLNIKYNKNLLKKCYHNLTPKFLDKYLVSNNLKEYDIIQIIKKNNDVYSVYSHIVNKYNKSIESNYLFETYKINKNQDSNMYQYIFSLGLEITLDELTKINNLDFIFKYYTFNIKLNQTDYL